MRTLVHKKIIGAVTLALVALALTAGGTMAAEVWLQAESLSKTMPGSTSVPMWGFRKMDTGWADLPDEIAQVPGPRLVVPPGEGLTIHLRNNLTTEPISIVIPGQVAAMTPTRFEPGDPNYPDRMRSFTNETQPGGGTADYAWPNLKEGTYLYHSGTHPQVQVQMGLYGAVTKDFAAGEAYSGVAYTKEILLLYSEVDPALHAAVAGGNYGPGLAVTSTIGYEPKYFLVNGASYPDPTTGLPTLATGDQVLFRFLNAGLETHVPVLQGLFVNLVAEDGNKGLGPGGASAPYPKTMYSVFLAAGQTSDAMLVQPAQAGPCNFAIYDRALHLTNAGTTNGGLYTFISLATTGGVPPRVDDTLMVTTDPGGGLILHWTDIGADHYYKVYESISLPPPFTKLTGGSASGSAGLRIPMPAANLVFYKVVATATCGVLEGPQD